MKFLREASVVVIGVAATLIASGRIARWSEQKEIALNLSAIKAELESNRVSFVGLERVFDKQRAYERFLRSAPRDKLNSDSIFYYLDDGLYQYVMITYDKSAFESFKSSGLMPKMKDRQLMLDIRSMYARLDMELEDFRNWEQWKTEIRKRDFASIEIYDGTWILNGVIPLYAYHIYGVGGYLAADAKRVCSDIDRLVARIDAAGTRKKAAAGDE